MQYSRLHMQPLRPQKKRRRPQPKLLVIPAILLLVGASTALLYNQFATNTIDAPQAQGVSTSLPPSRYNLQAVPLPNSGQGAIAVSEENMNIHVNSDKVWPMASVTKIITALAILHKAPLELGQRGESFTLTKKDEQYYWDYAGKMGTLTPVTAGYSMTVYEILQTMLLASSNNMTDSLVDRYFASHEEFVNYTNDMLKSYGLTETKVADASGFSPDSVSTPSEMIKIGKLALENPVIAEIVRQPNASPSVAGWIPNYNALINQPGVTGIKPGLTDQSGHNLLFSFETPNQAGELVTVIGIVMGIFDRPEYVNTLMSMYESAKVAVSAQ